jgi:hypothetical protein
MDNQPIHISNQIIPSVTSESLTPLTPTSITPESLTPESLTPESLTPESLTPESLTLSTPDSLTPSSLAPLTPISLVASTQDSPLSLITEPEEPEEQEPEEQEQQQEEQEQQQEEQEQQQEEKEEPEEPEKEPMFESPKNKSPTSASLTEAIDRYYKLKGAYDKKYNNAKKKLTAPGKGLSTREIKRKLKNLRIGCVNCKKSGGTIFTNKSRLLTAKCGHEEPCALDIQIQKGKWMLLPVAVEMTQERIAELKANIIDLKLDLLFGLRTEEQIMENFNEDKTDYKNNTKQLHALVETIESENIVTIDGDVPRKIPINQYLEIKNEQLQQFITLFKDKLLEYSADIDDPQISDPLLKTAIQLYIDDILPIMDKMRETKFAVTTMVEEDGLFVMKQVKTLLKNLDFEYEFGEIISDKK